MAHFTTDLPDWKTWRNLNENKELAEDKAIELYKKLLLAQTVMIEESLRQINTHNEALINAQGGSAGAGVGAGGGGTNAKILNVTNFIGTAGAGSTQYYRYMTGFTGLVDQAEVVILFDREVEVDPDAIGVPAYIANNDGNGGGVNSEVIFGYTDESVADDALIFAYSQSNIDSMSIVVPTSGIDTETNAIEYTGGTNLFKRGNLVQYSAEGGTVATGLTDGGVYYVLENTDSTADSFKLAADQTIDGNGNPFSNPIDTIDVLNITGQGNNSQTFKITSTFIACSTTGDNDTDDGFDALTMTSQITASGKDGGSTFTNLNSGSYSGSFSASAFFSSSNRLYPSSSAVWIVSGTVNPSFALTALRALPGGNGFAGIYVTEGDTLDLPDDFFGSKNSGSRITINSAAFITGSNDTLTFPPNGLWTQERAGYSVYPGVGGHIIDADDKEGVDLTYGAAQNSEPTTRTTLLR